jgi:putative ABC transport system ATP-binding protein
VLIYNVVVEWMEVWVEEEAATTWGDDRIVIKGNLQSIDFQSDKPVLEMQNLCKNYQLGTVEVQALRNIDLIINEGDYVAIMGPSGSGKSTLLNMIGCLDHPSSGQYFLGGQDVSKLEDDELSLIRGARIGFVFQSFNLISQLNIIENIEIPMYYQGISENESEQRARKLAEMVGLGERLKHRPSELSGGQQQRVAIARSLANDPFIILADEPTGNLDSESGADILKILDDLHTQGKTLITVTHDDNIATHAKRVIRLFDGSIEKEEYN